MRNRERQRQKERKRKEESRAFYADQIIVILNFISSFYLKA
jgi:hypothetical protein